MKDIIPAKKESPLLGLTGLGGGVSGNLGGSLDKTTFVDDVFSNYVYSGTGSNRNIVNGIDNTKGGLVWTKSRTANYSHILVDTERGTNKYLASSGTGGEVTDPVLTSFNNDGYGLGGSADVNRHGGYPFVGWNFRKAKGFFDIVTWTGTGSGRSISHNLGSVPGMIIVKKTNGGNNWIVYHRDTSSNVDNVLFFNSTDGVNTDSPSYWNNGGAQPTSTTFNVGWSDATNASGGEYVAYVFAGGESTAATARSVDFDGSGDNLTLGNSSDLSPESSDFTFECWLKPSSWTGNNWDIVYTNHITNGLYIGKDNSENFVVRTYGNTSYIETTNLPPTGQWTHVAVTRSGTTLKLFYNGILEKSGSTSDSFATGDSRIGMGVSGDTYDGLISNLRFVKGTVVYTSSFQPPTEPLTNITNTKLLCCQNSTVTGATVSPATITSGGDPTASTDSPFVDPKGLKFGENEDQGIIKCGSYIGNGNGSSTGGPKINLGWEPQWILIKNSSSNGNGWFLYDVMRGWFNNAEADRYLMANSSNAETTFAVGHTTPRGFRITTNNSSFNTSGDNYVFCAIRRPDGYVGKPAEAGTDTFAMDTGAGSSTIPNFDSGFPVDFLFTREPASGNHWRTSARLIGTNYLNADNGDAETTSSSYVWDSNVGAIANSSWGSNKQAWMWKRGAGFDVVAFQGTAVNPGPDYAHSLGQVPELRFIKRRNSSVDWIGTGTVVSQAMAGNNNSKDYWLYLNTDGAVTNHNNYWDGNDSATHFTVRHGNGMAGGSADIYLCLLFASVEGISKVGYYSGSTSQQTITLGFQPRFIFIKNTAGSRNWCVFDTVRGWAAGNDQELNLNKSDAQGGNNDFGAPTATGFTINYFGNDDTNNSGFKYIYYAHA